MNGLRLKNAVVTLDNHYVTRINGTNVKKGKNKRDLAEQLIQIQNEKLAEACAANPDRFLAFASVALQHPDLAAAGIGGGGLRGLRGRGRGKARIKHGRGAARAGQMGVAVHHAGHEGRALGIHERQVGAA